MPIPYLRFKRNVTEDMSERMPCARAAETASYKPLAPSFRGW